MNIKVLNAGTPSSAPFKLTDISANKQDFHSGLSRDLVSISVTAMQKSSQSTESNPSVPDHEDLQQKGKALVTYNMVQGLGDERLSPMELHAMKNNQQVRQAYVGKQALEHQIAMFEAAVESYSSNNDS